MGLFKTYTFCLCIPDLSSRDGHWASRLNYYAMNSYSLTATTVVCSGICLKAVLYFIGVFSDWNFKI